MRRVPKVKRDRLERDWKTYCQYSEDAGKLLQEASKATKASLKFNFADVRAYKLRAKSAQLRAEGNALVAKADMLWACTLIRELGNVHLEWNGAYQCLVIDTGDVFVKNGGGRK